MANGNMQMNMIGLAEKPTMYKIQNNVYERS